MLFSNRRLEEALAFIDSCGAHVVCLQEVPESLLPRLRALPFHSVEAIETSRVSRRGLSTQYLVILSRFRITRHARVPLPLREEAEPLRTRLFVGLMVGLGLWGRAAGNRHTLIADLDTPSGPLRVFNIHLPLTRSAWRLEEFELAMMNRSPALPSVVCGDFNTLESRRIAPLYWLLGSGLREAFSWRAERLVMEERFVAYALVNPLAGRITHPLSRSQLDHVLCSKDLAFSSAEVGANPHGSDHHPVWVTLDHI
jgi:endonuclease/exonuclease/phosphatase family metal-dependent hydrolase